MEDEDILASDRRDGEQSFSGVLGNNIEPLTDIDQGEFII